MSGFSKLFAVALIVQAVEPLRAQQNPATADAYFQAVSQFAGQGDCAQASQYLDYGIQVDPRAKAPWSVLGYCYDNKGKKKEALGAYRRAVFQNYGDEWAKNRLKDLDPPPDAESLKLNFENREFLILDLLLSQPANLMSLPQAGVSACAYVSFFPKTEGRQEVLKVKTEPKSEMKQGLYFFPWVRLTLGNFEPTLEAWTRVRNDRDLLNRKVAYPLQALTEEFGPYLQPGQILDINPDMAALAQSLVQGSDDLAEVVDRVAVWCHENIHYDLAAGGEGTNPSSQVFVQRQGVCDEFTALFASLLRSLGIPVRFVGGLAYTNSELFKERWGGHAWAEVYFPGLGWVPYDPTYGQYGFVDPSHVSYDYLQDAKGYDIKITANAPNVPLAFGPRKIRARVEFQGAEVKPQVIILAEMMRNLVSQDSCDAIGGEVRNLSDSYISVDVEVGQTDQVHWLSPAKIHAFLKPKEAKKIGWVFELGSELKKGFFYDFKIPVSAGRGGWEELKFRVAENGPSVSKSQAEDWVNRMQRGEIAASPPLSPPP